MGKDTNITWRQQNIEIPANSVKDVFFLDTYPNAFYIANNNDTEIYISLTYTPTVDKYEVELKRNDRDTFGRPTPTNRMYILNPSAKQISVTIFSAENMFDMALLKNFKVDIETATLNAIKYDGIIRGVANGVKVPIDGSVQVEFPPDLSIQATLPDNLSVDLNTNDQMSSLINMLTHLLTATEINGKVNLKSITKLLDQIVNKPDNSYSRQTMISGTISENGTIQGKYREIDFLVNDSENDVVLTFKKLDGTTIGGTFTLKSGEALNDIGFHGNGIDVSGTDVSVRYLLLY